MRLYSMYVDYIDLADDFEFGGAERDARKNSVRVEWFDS
jgi:hypothetical protein